MLCTLSHLRLLGTLFCSVLAAVLCTATLLTTRYSVLQCTGCRILLLCFARCHTLDYSVLCSARYATTSSVLCSAVYLLAVEFYCCAMHSTVVFNDCVSRGTASFIYGVLQYSARSCMDCTVLFNNTTRRNTARFKYYRWHNTLISTTVFSIALYCSTSAVYIALYCSNRLLCTLLLL